MALLLQITPPSSPSFYNSIKFKFNSNPKSNPNHFLTLKPPNSLKSSSSTTSISTLNSIKPYVQSQWQPILKAYLCSVVSVYSLSKIVPKMGTFSATMTTLNPLLLRDEGLALGALFVVRVVASYYQQSFLWDAALSSVYRIRVDVFERVLARELGFWEGIGGALSGDVAYRITAEAADVADTVYALLNVGIPSLFVCNLCSLNCISIYSLKLIILILVKLLEVERLRTMETENNCNYMSNKQVCE